MPMGCRYWVILVVPAEVAFLALLECHRGYRIEGVVVENQFVVNCSDLLERPLQRVRQVPHVSSQLFAERTAKMAIV